MQGFKKSAANQNPRDPELLEADPLMEPIWAEEDYALDMEFGKKVDSFGQRIYEIFLE